MKSTLARSYLRNYLKGVSPTDLEELLCDLEPELSETHFRAFQTAVRQGEARRYMVGLSNLQKVSE